MPPTRNAMSMENQLVQVATKATIQLEIHALKTSVLVKMVPALLIQLASLIILRCVPHAISDII